jgi:hypothetical protein
MMHVPLSKGNIRRASRTSLNANRTSVQAASTRKLRQAVGGAGLLEINCEKYSPHGWRSGISTRLDAAGPITGEGFIVRKDDTSSELGDSDSRASRGGGRRWWREVVAEPRGGVGSGLLWVMAAA